MDIASFERIAGVIHDEAAKGGVLSVSVEMEMDPEALLGVDAELHDRTASDSPFNHCGKVQLVIGEVEFNLREGAPVA